MRRALLVFPPALLLLGILLFALAWWTATPDIGRLPTGEALRRHERSAQWDGQAFANPLPPASGSSLEVLRGELRRSAVQRPEQPLPTAASTESILARAPASGLRVTWLGHSTLWIELDGARLLIDPVWGDRASPWQWMGPARFQPPPLPLESLGPIDAVIISHDHYDHLDRHTIQGLANRPLRFVVPLGVGAHLEHWGVPRERIDELDWWEQIELAGLRLTATPARHFSGRWLNRFRSTLWAGWALRGPEHAVFYSGDSGMHPQLEEIGARLGPFDLSMMDAGAYNQAWTDVHLGPEQAVIAHQLVRAERLLPVHWGMYDLSSHTWTEPMERVLAAAERQGVQVITPRLGQPIEPVDPPEPSRWWPSLPTRSAEEYPIWSTRMDRLLDRWWGARAGVPRPD